MIDECCLIFTAMGLGAAIVIGYDLLRILRRIMLRGTLLVLMEDLLFGMMAATAIFVFFYENTEGKIRCGLLLAMLIGGMLYSHFIGRYLLAIVSTCICKWKKQLKCGLKDVKIWLAKSCAKRRKV